MDHACIEGIGNIRLHLTDGDRCGLDQSILVACLGGRAKLGTVAKAAHSQPMALEVPRDGDYAPDALRDC
jgi:hypothetical protein